MKLLLIFALLISGCGIHQHHVNSRLTPESVATIQKGKSTKPDILAALGPPQTTQKKTPETNNYPAGMTPPPIAAASEIWTYWSQSIEGEAVVLPFYASTTTSGGNTILSVYFNDVGTVIDYTTMQTNY